MILRRFLSQPFYRQRLLLETTIFLLVARVAVRLLSFQKLTWFLNLPSIDLTLDPATRKRQRDEVKWAIDVCCRYLPGKTVCFPQGLAAQAMLRRRGIATTVFYGATTHTERGLTAHVWVQDGAEDVIGGDGSGHYKILAQYPNDSNRSR